MNAQAAFKNEVFNGLVLVDDDSLLLEIVTWITKSSEYQTRLFSNPELAFEFLSRCQPKMLIVDYYMPGTSGIDFIRGLSAEGNLAETASFLCSALPPSEVTHDVLSELNIKLLHKDIVCSRDSLLSILAEHLTNS